MGVASEPRAPDSPSSDPENVQGSSVQRPTHARTSGDFVGTTTTTSIRMAGIQAATDSIALRGAEPSRQQWLLLCSRHKKSALSEFSVCMAKPSAKVSADVESLRYENVEAGGSSACDANTAPHVSSAPKQATSPATVGASFELGIDLETAKGSGEKTVPSLTFLGHLLTMYSDALDKRPVFTKSLSSGLIGLLGDLLAQSVELGFGGGPAPWNNRRALWRSCAVMLDGFFINGPFLHYLYEFLEECMPAGKSIHAAVLQVGVDVFIIDPVFGFIFVWSTGLFEGRSAKHDILHTLQYNYPTMVLWLIVIGLAWAPLQIYLFNRYPVQYRVLLADLIDLVWTCVSSLFCHAR